MVLRSHLRGDLRVAGRHANDARLLNVVGQRLLTVDVLPQLKGRQSGKGVSMFRGADDHRIKLLLVVKQFAEIIRFAGLGCFTAAAFRFLSLTSQRATMFSPENLPRLLAPRPPVPIIAMLSFSLRLRARTMLGAEKAVAARPQHWFSERIGDR